MSIVRTRQDIGLRVLAGAPVHDISVGAASLPSGDAALRLVRGQPEAIVPVISTVLVRGALIAGGLAIVGFRGMQLLSGATAAVLAVEAGVLVWAWSHRKDRA